MRTFAERKPTLTNLEGDDLRSGSRLGAVQHAVDQVIQQPPQLVGLNLVGNRLGSLLVLLDQPVRLLEHASLLVQLADALRSRHAPRAVCCSRHAPRAVARAVAGGGHTEYACYG